MADLIITAANVKAGGSSLNTKLVQVGVAVTEGEVVYQSSADSKYYKTSAATEEQADAAGIVLTPAALDGYALIATAGDIAISTLVLGQTYFVSTAAGKIRPASDIIPTSGYLTYLGYAISTSVLRLMLKPTGVNV